MGKTTLLILLAAGAAVFYFAVLRKPGGLGAPSAPPPIPQKPSTIPAVPPTPWYEKLAGAAVAAGLAYANSDD